jgi:hypothetical protein
MELMQELCFKQHIASEHLGAFSKKFAKSAPGKFSQKQVTFFPEPSKLEFYYIL